MEPHVCPRLKERKMDGGDAMKRREKGNKWRNEERRKNSMTN